MRDESRQFVRRAQLLFLITLVFPYFSLFADPEMMAKLGVIRIEEPRLRWIAISRWGSGVSPYRCGSSGVVEAALAKGGTWLRCRIEHSKPSDGFSCDLSIRARRALCFLHVSALPQSITVAFSGITLS